MKVALSTALATLSIEIEVAVIAKLPQFVAAPQLREAEKIVHEAIADAKKNWGRRAYRRSR